MSTRETPPPQAAKVDLAAVLDVVKSMGLLVGGLGGIAILFFWIGNAIIVARLRAYNLYGVVHYTDEYVTEAGYQFFQDIFTFFQDWRLIPFFLFLMALLLVTVPVGGESGTATEPPGGALARAAGLLRRWRIHYAVFLTLALSAALILTSGWFVQRLSAEIVTQERVLTDVAADLRSKVLILLPRKGAEEGADPFRQRFFDELTFGVEPTERWVEEALGKLSEESAAPLTLASFQQQFSIQEPPAVLGGEDFGRSETYLALRNVWLSHRLQELLAERAALTLEDFRSLLSGHLTSEGDTASLVLIPANYDLASESVRRLQRLRDNIEAFFEPADADTRHVLEKLAALKPIAFGQFMLSYSFWVLVGILVYLLLNSTRLLRFRPWELAYFVVTLLLFLTVLITLPTAYGRFKFEFKVQLLKEIVFAGEETGKNPLRKKLDDARARGAELYLLGPTKGREVIIGAFGGLEPLGASAPQIIMLERETYSYLSVEPVRPDRIPGIIRLLRQKGWEGPAAGAARPLEVEERPP